MGPIISPRREVGPIISPRQEVGPIIFWLQNFRQMRNLVIFISMFLSRPPQVPSIARSYNVQLIYKYVTGLQHIFFY